MNMKYSLKILYCISFPYPQSVIKAVLPNIKTREEFICRSFQTSVKSVLKNLLVILEGMILKHLNWSISGQVIAIRAIIIVWVWELRVRFPCEEWSKVKWSLVPWSSWSVYSIIIDELLSGVIEWRAVQCLICTGQLVPVLYAIILLLIWFKEMKNM